MREKIDQHQQRKYSPIFNNLYTISPRQILQIVCYFVVFFLFQFSVLIKNKIDSLHFQYLVLCCVVHIFCCVFFLLDFS